MRQLDFIVIAFLAACVLGTSGCRTEAEAGTESASILSAAPRADPPRSGRDPSTLPDPLPRQLNGPVARGTTEVFTIDTNTFGRRIDRRRFDGVGVRPASFLPPHRKPKLDFDRPENDLPVGDPVPIARTTPENAFPGIRQTPWSPPDPSIAVGPQHVLETVNMKIAWFDKSGTPQFEQFLDDTGDPGFFEEVGAGGFTFDPKCFYDPHAERYVVLALEFYSGAGEAWMTFAVSDDDDPDGLWFKYRTWALIESEGSEYWVDYPGFGYDENAWYITSNLFELGNGPGPGFLGGLVRVIDKSGPLSGETAEWSDLIAGGASWQVAQAPAAGQSTRIVRQAGGDQLEIGRIEDPLGDAVLTTALVDVPNVDFDNAAPTPVGDGLWIVDPRIINATIRDEVLWLGNHGRRPGSTVASAVWYAIDCGTDPPLLDQAGAFTFSNDEHSFFPALAVNGLGDAAIGFGRSGPGLDPVIEVAGRRATDPPGTMSTSVRVGASVTSPTGGGGPDGLSRWGDYFDCTVDPVDDRTFWMVGELQDADGWTTEIHRFTVGLAADLNGDGVVNGADFGLLLAAFGDAGGPADLNRDGLVDGGDAGLMLSDWSD